MQLIFERSKPGRGSQMIASCDVPVVEFDAKRKRTDPPRLPEIAEVDLMRHYTELSDQVFGVNNGFYPLGSCTMKYNPKINEEMAALPGFAKIHPLQPEHTVQGAIEALCLAEKLFGEITGMDNMSFQPAAGAHGEYSGVLLIKAYHESRGDYKRDKIIVPDSAHGTNPATAVMAGYKVVNVPSGDDGCVNIEALRAAVGEDTAGLMLTNPNTVGIFDKNIVEITNIIHEAGGLCYYDGANLNAVMGICKPGEMGFDVIHLNLHKTFSTPHGGGGPGSGPVGCKAFLAPFLPAPHYKETAEGFAFTNEAESFGKVRSFYGNFLVTMRALTYVLTLGKEGIPEAAENAVLNANYLMKLLSEKYTMAYPAPCMHEFIITIDPLKKAHGVTATDIAKSLLEHRMHPPTMYFPLIVPEALMVEPTETESKDALDAAAAVYLAVYDQAVSNPQRVHDAPLNTPIRRVDEVGAARNPVTKYAF